MTIRWSLRKHHHLGFQIREDWGVKITIILFVKGAGYCSALMRSLLPPLLPHPNSHYSSFWLMAHTWIPFQAVEGAASPKDFPAFRKVMHPITGLCNVKMPGLWLQSDWRIHPSRILKDQNSLETSWSL